MGLEIFEGSAEKHSRQDIYEMGTLNKQCALKMNHFFSICAFSSTAN